MPTSLLRTASIYPIVLPTLLVPPLSFSKASWSRTKIIQIAYIIISLRLALEQRPNESIKSQCCRNLKFKELKKKKLIKQPLNYLCTEHAFFTYSTHTLFWCPFTLLGFCLCTFSFSTSQEKYPIWWIRTLTNSMGFLLLLLLFRFVFCLTGGFKCLNTRSKLTAFSWRKTTEWKKIKDLTCSSKWLVRRFKGRFTGSVIFLYHNN